MAWTIRECLANAMAAGNLQDVQALDARLADGTVISINRDNDPRMDMVYEDSVPRATITPKTSATAGTETEGGEILELTQVTDEATIAAASAPTLIDPVEVEGGEVIEVAPATV